MNQEHISAALSSYFQYMPMRAIIETYTIFPSAPILAKKSLKNSSPFNVSAETMDFCLLYVRHEKRYYFVYQSFYTTADCYRYLHNVCFLSNSVDYMMKISYAKRHQFVHI